MSHEGWREPKISQKRVTYYLNGPLPKLILVSSYSRYRGDIVLIQMKPGHQDVYAVIILVNHQTKISWTIKAIQLGIKKKHFNYYV